MSKGPGAPSHECGEIGELPLLSFAHFKHVHSTDVQLFWKRSLSFHLNGMEAIHWRYLGER